MKFLSKYFRVDFQHFILFLLCLSSMEMGNKHKFWSQAGLGMNSGVMCIKHLENLLYLFLYHEIKVTASTLQDRYEDCR